MDVSGFWVFFFFPLSSLFCSASNIWLFFLKKDLIGCSVCESQGPASAMEGEGGTALSPSLQEGLECMCAVPQPCVLLLCTV